MGIISTQPGRGVCVSELDPNKGMEKCSFPEIYEVDTESVSASSDFYSAYFHGKLPPSTGWVSRLPGISPTAGCGCNPPPVHVGIFAVQSAREPLPIGVEPDSVVSTVGCSAVVPRLLEVSGAGSVCANGIYKFEGEISCRPYYRKVGGSECVWYFNSCPLEKPSRGSVSYNGWYISREVNTSSCSAAQDMYSYYGKTFVVPLSPVTTGKTNGDCGDSGQAEWVVRRAGVGPTAGCGVAPAPRVLPYYCDDDATMARCAGQSVMLVRVSLPDGRIKSIPISELDTTTTLQIKLDEVMDVPFFRILLFNKGSLLTHSAGKAGSAISLLGDRCVSVGDLVVVELAADEGKAEIPWHDRERAGHIEAMYTTFALERPRRVVVVGAGPVGLWICAHLKILRSHWHVTCVEKREQYKRSHALRLDVRAFEGMVQWAPGRTGAAELQLLRETWMPRTRTAIVESDLRRLCETLGVDVRYNVEVTSLIALARSENLNGTTDVIIACDGAKSACRQLLLTEHATSETPTGEAEGTEFKCSEQLCSLLQVKFDAHGDVCTSKGMLASFLHNLPAKNEFFNILSGNFDSSTCSTPLTVFALLNDDVVHSLKAINSPQGSSIDAPSATSNDPSIEMLLDLDAVLASICPAGIVPDSLSISVLPVAYSVAAAPCRSVSIFDGDVNAVNVVLSGDAAMGLPLEKGLNFGWRIASRLCSYLIGCEDVRDALLGYNEYFTRLSAEAVAEVHHDYENYLHTIATAASVRSLLSPFIKHGATAGHISGGYLSGLVASGL